jgi:hypothetical protein
VGAAAISTDNAGSIYIANGTTVIRRPLGGGDSVPVGAADFPVQQIVPAGAEVFLAVPRHGIEDLVSGAMSSIASAPEVVSIAIDDGYVYWAANTGTGVFRAPRDGGARETIAFQFSQFVATDDKHVYWDDGCNVYSADKDRLALHTTVVQNACSILGITLDDTFVYVASGAAPGVNGVGEIARVPKAGGATQTLTVPIAAAGAFTNSCGDLYWTNVEDGGALSLMTAPKSAFADAGAPRRLTTFQVATGSDTLYHNIATDDHAVYIADDNGVRAIQR